MENFNGFYIKYINWFTRYARTYVNNSSAAEDIAAEAMITCWHNRQNIPNFPSAISYMNTVIKNKSINYIKHVQSRQKAVGQIDDKHTQSNKLSITTINTEEMLCDDINDIVAKTMQTLPPKTQKIFFMSRRQNKSNKDIADEISLTVKSVEYHTSKAMDALRLALRDYLTAENNQNSLKK